MALQVVSMEQLRMGVVLEPERTGDSVAEVCRRRGIRLRRSRRSRPRSRRFTYITKSRTVDDLITTIHAVARGENFIIAF